MMTGRITDFLVTEKCNGGLTFYRQAKCLDGYTKLGHFDFNWWLK